MLYQVGFPLFKRARLPNALRAFGWVSENWDPLKGTRWLPPVDPPGRGVTILLVLELGFQNSCHFSESNGYRWYCVLV